MTLQGVAGTVGERWRTRNSAPMRGPLFVSFLLVPFGALLLGGFVFPLVRALGDSLTGGGPFASEYSNVLGDRIVWLVLGRTFAQAAEVSITCIVLGYAIAEMIRMARPSLRPVLLALVVIPLWSSAVARTYSWIGVFQLGGLIDSVAGWFGVSPLHLLFTQLSVIVGMVHVLLPFTVLPLYAAVQRYDRRLDQASLSLGASRPRTLLKVKLPVLAPQIIATGAGSFVIALGFYITPAVLGGPRSQMISNLIAQQVFQRDDLPRAEAISVVLVVSTITVIAVGGIIGWLYRRTSSR